MQSSAKCQSQAVLLAITSLVSSWGGRGGGAGGEKKAGLLSHGLGVQDQESQLPFLELKKKKSADFMAKPALSSLLGEHDLMHPLRSLSAPRKI